MVRFIDSALFAIVYPISLVGSVVAGFFVARYLYYNKNIVWKASGIENGIIGLFALLLSFTLLMSGNIQRERTVMVHQFADGVAQVERMTALVPSSARDSIADYLRQHLDLHINYYENKIDRPDELVTALNRLNGNFWQHFPRQSDSSGHTLRMQLLPVYNQLNSSSYKLIYSYMERVPALIIFLIIISSLLIGLLVGFMNGFHEKRHYLVPLIYVVIVSLMVQSIRDLDNPYAGSIRPKYDNLKDLRKLI
ncbi:MAG: hypothetical protein H7122_00010 [Chitinophagaceae bacterium]|nr:hypothetical protein [Chitinophagaceae bacterium]